jgi:basic membrane protein A
LALLFLSISAGYTAQAQQGLRVTFVINGTLGDKSYFDSAERGLERAQKDFGIKLKSIELGEDSTKWESGLEDAMADVKNYDVLVAQGGDLASFMVAHADKYPDKKFIYFDEPLDFTKCKCANVYNVIFAQNESSYLGGVYAAAMLKDGKLPNLANKDTIAAVGGQDVPVIEDFIKGYTQGAKSVDPKVNVLVTFIGGENPWGDPAKGKETANSLYDQGADIVFGIAGGSGDGIIEAAKDRNKYTLGVDSDQALVYMDSDPKKAAQILTSVMKNVDNTLYRAISLDKQGKLAYGKTETVGLAEGGVGLAVNDIYNKVTPDSVKKIVAQAQADIVSCKIKVDTALTPRTCVPATMEPTLAATAAQ